MSYDLFFRHPGGEAPTADRLRAWFAGRRSYTVSCGTAAYEDQATGVSFEFELTDHQDGIRVPAAFALPYLRPSVFALEAAEELSALVDTFDLEVFDPQRSGIGQGRFQAEGFLRGWRAGNLHALRARIGADPSSLSELKTLPTATHTAVWGWNRAREAYLDRLGSVESSPCFVPAVFLVSPRDAPQAVLTAAIWAEGTPTVMPDVDVVLWTGAPGSPPRTVAMASLFPVLQRWEQRPAGHRFGLNGRVYELPLAHRLIDDDLSDDDHERIWSLGAVRSLVRCPPATVLDRETVARAFGSGGAPPLRRSPQS